MTEFNIREHAIARMIIEGFRNKEIASALNRSENAVKNYLRIMFDKSGMSSRFELATWYMHHFVNPGGGSE